MIYLGAKAKMAVSLEPVDGLRMSDYDFECAFFVYTNRKVIKRKPDMKRIDDDNYLVTLEVDDIQSIGKGRLNVEVTAHIPDADFSDGIRIEKLLICTDFHVM